MWIHLILKAKQRRVSMKRSLIQLNIMRWDRKVCNFWFFCLTVMAASWLNIARVDIFSINTICNASDPYAISSWIRTGLYPYYSKNKLKFRVSLCFLFLNFSLVPPSGNGETPSNYIPHQIERFWVFECVWIIFLSDALFFSSILFTHFSKLIQIQYFGTFWRATSGKTVKLRFFYMKTCHWRISYRF